MKSLLLTLLLALGLTMAQAQHKLSYRSYVKGEEEGESSITEITQSGPYLKIVAIEDAIEHPIPGLASSTTYVDYAADSVFTLVQYPDAFFSTAYEFAAPDGFTDEGKETILGYPCTKYKTSINSNTIEVWMTEKLDFQSTPKPSLGKLKGVMVRCAQNGTYLTDLVEVKKDKNIAKARIPEAKGKRVSGRQLSQIRKDRLVIRIPVFNDDQIHFAEYQNPQGELPFDSVIHFSSGTVIVKRLKLPQLPEHYQLFAEIKQRSSGDAYDRTASVFVIPTDKAKSLLDGLQNGPDAMPIFTGKDGQQYQGIKLEEDFQPALELVRFFTSFGVGHFNDRVKIDGLEWLDENYYKMEISELKDRLHGDVIVGAFIGNYDGGGHRLSLDLLAYPGDYSWDESPSRQHSQPLFNTCNVMEMSGQNYGRLFLTDTLEVSFEIPENASDIRLRYISTGHGGWDGGDEFNPKENQILIDDEMRFTHTPWRCDCATYRDQNPVSGNFWNGVSSSDYSRSGWCPGTATNPVYFDLNGLQPGRHTLRVVIPQGENEGEGFSHWMVSGCLIYKML